MKTNQRNSFRALGKTLLITVLTFFVLSYVCAGIGYGILRSSSFRYSRMYNGGIHAHLLVAGNSRGVNLLLGSASTPHNRIYNISYVGNSLADTIAMMKGYFSHGNTADITLFEVTAFYTNNPMPPLKTYWPLYPELKAEQITNPELRKIAAWSRVLPLIQYNSQLFLRLLYFATVQRHSDQNWGDHHTLNRRMCRELPVGAKLFLKQQPDKANIRAQLKDLTDWLQQHGYRTQIAFVFAPLLDQPRSHQLIRALAGESRRILQGYDYTDLSTYFHGDCHLFSDTLHPGPAGRKKLAKYFLAKYPAPVKAAPALKAPAP